MHASEQKYRSIETADLSDINTANKFRAYRLEVETKERRLKEAEIVIHQLKEEISFSRNAEKNLRSQISSAQNRLTYQEKLLKKFVNVSVQQQENNKISEQIKKDLGELTEKINQTRQVSKNVFKYASKELELLKKIKDLESELSAKDRENDLTKMEFQTLTKEKKDTEAKEKIKVLEIELEKSLKKEAESLALNRETLLFYKKQIEDYEEKIKEYEDERRSFLEDFAPPNGSTIIPENFPLADSTVNLNVEERSPILKKRHNVTQTDETTTQIFQCSLLPEKSKSTSLKRGKGPSLKKMPVKQKPQLEFLTASQNSPRPVSSTGLKRRLFSTNCNHYLD